MRRIPVTAIFGILIVAINVIAVVFAPWISPYGETAIVGTPWEAPSEAFWFGTDSLGRDLLTRVLYGAHNTIPIAFLTTIVAMVIGVGFGFLAAVKGKLTDQVLSRIVDTMISVPALILTLLILSIFGTTTVVLIITVGFVEATRVFRLARAVAVDLMAADFVEISQLRGEGIWYITTREILVNALAPLSAEFGLRFCFTFLFISTISFLGLGIQPPLADWGSMVRENSSAIGFGIFTPLIPAFSIALLTVGVNLIVDWFLHITSGLKHGH